MAGICGVWLGVGIFVQDLIFFVGFVRFGKFGSDFGSVAGNWEIWLGFRRCDWEFGNVLGIL